MKTHVIRIRSEDYNRLAKHKEAIGVPIVEIIHRAINEYFEKMNAEKILTDQTQQIKYDQLVKILRDLLQIK